MLLHDVLETSRKVQSQSSRLAKIEHLADYLRRLEPEEIGAGVAYLSGELPQGRIGVGYAAVRDALTEASEEHGLSLLEVDRTFSSILQTSGPGSARARAELLRGVFARATRDEQDFLSRLLGGELRQGAQEGIMTDALARAAGISAGAVRRALMLSSDMGKVARAALTAGAAGLGEFQLKVFCPVGPMLAQTAEDTASAMARLGRAAAEYKLDGARIQVHRLADDVRVFTRGMHDVTARVPEIVELARAMPGRALILDGEAIALREDGAPQPFQVTMRRFGRKLDVHESRRALPLTPFFFDVLHLDGQDLLDESTERRFTALEQALGSASAIPRRIVTSAEELDAFSTQALQAGHEGVMIKSLEAPYEAGRRGASWLKLKPAHSLDLVVLAAEWGNGRRQGWLSNLHLGARDPHAGGFVMLGKTFKGMTDAMLEWQTRELVARELTRDAYTVYVKPELVVEVLFDGVQDSSHYPGGLALRFARVKRYRTDKRADEADVIDTVRAIRAGERRTEGG
jgi:DNA ligase-1